MGEEGWSGTADERRVQLTNMTLISRPVQPEEAFSAILYRTGKRYCQTGLASVGVLCEGKNKIYRQRNL